MLSSADRAGFSHLAGIGAFCTQSSFGLETPRGTLLMAGNRALDYLDARGVASLGRRFVRATYVLKEGTHCPSSTTWEM